MNINPKIFRNYDIRGIVEEDLTPEVVESIGKAFGTILREKGKKEIFIGRDARLSSPALRDHLMKGLISTGLKVIDLGMVPTPVFYFAVFYKKKDGGVQITGSHNPPEYNGFKLMVGEDTLFGEQIKEIYKRIIKGNYIKDIGGSIESYDIIPEYKQFLVNNVKIERELKIVIDAGNGVGGFVAVPIFKELGAEVIELYTEPDGKFPNHHPDPTVPEYMKDLIEKVVEVKADFGIGYDGDADRIGVVDDKGNLLFGDQIVYILAKELLKEKPGCKIIADVKASQTLFDAIKEFGGIPIMWKTGHSFIKNKIKEENAELAGEMSGHIFFKNRYFGFDDAIYSSVRFAEVISRYNKKVSEWVAEMPKVYNTPEIRRESTEEHKFQIVEELKKRFKEKGYNVIDVDGVRAVFPDGWGLVRASNTQPVLVLRFEAKSEESLEKIRKLFEDELNSIEENLKRKN